MTKCAIPVKITQKLHFRIISYPFLINLFPVIITHESSESELYRNDCIISGTKQFKKVRSVSSTTVPLHYTITMSTYNIQQNVSEQTKTKLGIVGLAALPVIAAMYSSGTVSLEQVPQILSSGVFPIGMTLFSWTIAAKMALKLRK